jgi:hypothetical protein
MSRLEEGAIKLLVNEEHGREDAMRWFRESRIRGVLLILVAVVIYVIIWGMIPVLWPYRDHPLVWVLLAFLSGGHLEELFREAGTLL